MFTIEELEKIFKQKKQRIEKTVSKKGVVRERLIAGFQNTKLGEFEEWYKKSDYDKGCYYCKTLASKSEELYKKAIQEGSYNWTRGGKRGKRLELDRKDPSKIYDNLNNLVWCCYWCNNAKSNFFTADEFKPIAFAIGEALKKV